MANSTKVAQIMLTANAQQPERVINNLNQLARQFGDQLMKEVEYLKTLEGQYSANSSKYKQQRAIVEALEKDIRTLASAQVTEIEKTKTLGMVIDDLANTKLRDLKSALGAGKRDLARLTGSPEDLEKAKQIRQQMKVIGDQVRLLEGQYVNVGDALSRIGKISDDVLGRAIKQQKEQLAWMEKTDAQYAREESRLRMLEAEEAKRAALNKSQRAAANQRELFDTANSMKYSVSSGGLTGMSQQQIEEGKKAMIDYQKTLTMGSSTWKEYGDAIAKAEKYMNSFTQKAERTTKITGDAARNVREVLKNPFSASQENVQMAIESLSTRLRQLPADSKGARKVKEEIERLQGVIKGTVLSQEQFNKVIANPKKASIDDLKKAYAMLQQQLNSMERDNSEAYAKMEQDARRLKQEIDSTTKSVQEQGRSWKDTAKELLGYAAAFSVLDELKDKLSEAVRQNLSFGDALADVRKVSGLSAEQVGQLANNLAKIDTRTTIEDLQKLAYEGGKLGIGSYGIQGLQGFVEAANQIKVALGDDLGGEALTQLSKITGVMGDMQNLGVEKSLLAVGSSINELAQSSVASGSAIVDFTQRMSGIGKYAKMPTSDLMALGAACDAAGLSMETSGTAFSIMVSNLQKQPKIIEESLGVMDGSISKLVEQGQMMAAVQLTLEKMGEKNSMGQLTETFKALGGAGAKMMSVLATMSKNTNMLTDALDTSRTAFAEATSVTQEYNNQQMSANAILERANNLWTKAFVNPDGVDNVKELTKAWYDLSVGITSNPLFSSAVQATFAALGIAVKSLIALLPMLITLLGGMGLAKAVTYIVPLLSAARVGLERMTLAVTGNTVAAGRMALAWRGLSLAMKTNVFILAASVIVELAFAIYKFCKNTNDADKAVYNFQRDIEKAGSESAAAEKRVDRFARAIKDAGKNEKERMAAIKTFNKEYGQYMSQLLTEKSTVEDLAKAYAEVVKNMRARALAEAKEKSQKVVDQKYVSARSWSNRFEQQTKGTDLEAWTRDRLEAYFQDARRRNMSAEAMIKDLGDRFRVGEGATNDIIRTWSRRDQLGQIKYGKTAFTRKANKEEESLWLASRYVMNEISAENAQKALDKAYSGLDTKGTVTPETTETTTTTEDNKDKDINRAANDARANITEFITKIRNYYERQVTAEIERMTAENIDMAVQQNAVKIINEEKRKALAAAQQAVVLGTTEVWDEFVPDMAKMLKEKDDEYGQSQSRSLLDAIQTEDVKKLRADLLAERVRMKKGKAVGTYSEEQDRAYIDREWLMASKLEQQNASEQQKQMAERQKEMLENDYTGKVKQMSYESLYNLGFVNPNVNSQAEYAFDKNKIISMLEKARTEIESIVMSDGDKKSIFDILGIDYTDPVFKPLLDAESTDFALFYKKLIQYSEEYTDAEKRQSEARKKRMEYEWKNDPNRIAKQGEINDTTIAKKSYDIIAQGSPTLSAVTGDDPEIRMLNLKLELAKMYYDFLAEHQADQDTLMQQQQKIAELTQSVTQALSEEFRERATALQSMVGPIAEFGNAMGEAFATMTVDAEEGRAAFQEAMQSMMKSLVELTIKMSVEYANQAAIRKKLTKKGEREANRETEKGEKEHTKIIDEAGVAQNAMVGSVQAGLLAIRQKTATQSTAIQRQQAAEDVATTQNQTIADVVLGIAGGSAKIIEKLGFWGIPLIAVITALLNGLMAFATSKVSSLFGGGSSSGSAQAPKVNTKLVSGMLTYDQGNLKQMYLGNDGKLYAAKSEEQLPTGIVTQPVATTINGQPSLVGERGPELVVGRETTAAMMQNAPQLLQALLDYDKNHRLGALPAYDRGNVASVVTDAPVTTASPQSGISEELLTQLLYYLQHPVAPNINMYGREGLHAKMQQADRFMKGK